MERKTHDMMSSKNQKKEEDMDKEIEGQCDQRQEGR